MSDHNKAFLQALAKRSLTIDALATMIFSGRSHLVQVLRGSRKGSRTWNKLARVLSMEEMSLAVAFANSHLQGIGCRVQLKAANPEKPDAEPQYEVVELSGTGGDVPRRTKTPFAGFQSFPT